MTDFAEHDIAMMENWAGLRESKDISLEDVAQKTNIPIRKLRALETHDFSGLGSETFATGYIRAYAKILREDPEVFLKVYRDAIHGGVDEALASLGVSEEGEKPSSSPFPRINMLYLSIAVVIAWLLIMAVFNLVGSDSEPSTQESVALSSPDDSSLQSPASATPVPQAEGETEISAEEISGADVVVAAPEPQPQEPAAVTPAQPPEEPAPAPEAQPVEGVLFFTFTDDCWLEVIDSSGSVLIAQLQRKGDNQRILGQGPFEVMLGNALAATLTFNGEVVDTSPRLGRDTLKLTVPRP